MKQNFGLGLVFLLASTPLAQSAYIGWGVGSAGTLVRSADGGNTWVNYASNAGFHGGSLPFHPDLYAVSFPDPQDGWIAGANGFIEHTSNGGNTWTIQNDPTTQTLYRIKFVDAQNGWAVGGGGAIVHTSDAGSHWSSQTSGTVNNLNGLSFFDASNGWAVGDNGTILHTSNGGSTWNAQSSGSSYQLFSTNFASALEGWAVGYAETLMRTNNGGSTWIPQTGPFGSSGAASGDLGDVALFDSLRGWVVGDKGVGYTSDGGTTWTTYLTNQSGFNRISFPDPLNGWVSDEGDMFHTTDGGMTWSPQSVFPTTNNAIDDITFFNSVPEPSSLALLISALPLLLRRRSPRVTNDQ